MQRICQKPPSQTPFERPSTHEYPELAYQHEADRIQAYHGQNDTHKLERRPEKVCHDSPHLSLPSNLAHRASFAERYCRKSAAEMQRDRAPFSVWSESAENLKPGDSRDNVPRKDVKIAKFGALLLRFFFALLACPAREHHGSASRVALIVTSPLCAGPGMTTKATFQAGQPAGMEAREDFHRPRLGGGAVWLWRGGGICGMVEPTERMW